MTSLVFQSAVYVLAPAFNGWHVRQAGADEHPILPEQILLHEPLHPDPFAKICTAANGRNTDRFIWWQQWHKTSIKDIYYAFEKMPDNLYLLIFHQPKRGHTNPFRLFVTEVSDQFPKGMELWRSIAEQITSLPLV